MDTKTIHQQIDILLETLAEQEEKMMSYAGRIPQIEIDIFLKNIRDLYEFSTVLDKLNTRENTLPSPEKTKVAPVVNPVEMKEHEETEHYETVITDLEVEVPKLAPATPVTSNTVAAEVKPAVGKDKRKKTISEGMLFEDQLTIGEQFEKKQSLHEKLSEKKAEANLSDKLSRKRIENLKAAIGINDKFSFINHLFDGSSDDYNEALEYLENCGNYTEAETYVKNQLSSKFSWEQDNPAMPRFMEFLEKRYLA